MWENACARNLVTDIYDFQFVLRNMYFSKFPRARNLCGGQIKGFDNNTFDTERITLSFARYTFLHELFLL